MGLTRRSEEEEVKLVKLIKSSWKKKRSQVGMKYFRLALLCSVILSQVPARAKHFLIKTADDTAVDEAASLNQNEPDREDGSLNRRMSQVESAHDHKEWCRQNPHNGWCNEHTYIEWCEHCLETSTFDECLHCEDFCEENAAHPKCTSDSGSGSGSE